MTWNLEQYRVQDAARLLTPALLVYPEAVDSNIQATLRLAGGDPDRWRPHIKTAKIPYVIERLLAFGVRHFKCSTTLELSVLCHLRVADVLLAMPLVGAAVRRVHQLAQQYPATRISVLIENESQLAAWQDSAIGIFVDINPGMNRTGLDDTNAHAIRNLAQLAGRQFRGLHYYDGHVSGDACHTGYARLLALLTDALAPEEIITSGTPAMPSALRYEGFRQGSFTHRVSAGTVVYNDLTSLDQLPGLGYRPAVLVLASVVSHPTANIVTCDAGHKAVSVDAGVPNCAVLGWPALTPQKPSEEHLPLRAGDGDPIPQVGELLYLLPRHVCPTVNNFDHAILIQHGDIDSLQPVAARGHESPLVIHS